MTYAHEGRTISAELLTVGDYVWCQTPEAADVAEKQLPAAFLERVADELIEKGFLQVIRHENKSDPLSFGPHGEPITVGVKLTLAKDVRYLGKIIKVEDES